MNVQLFQLISFLGAVQGCLVAFVILSKKRTVPARLFAVFLIFFSIGLLEGFFSKVLGPDHFFSTLVSFSNLLYGPLIYVMVKSLWKRVSLRQIVLHSSFFVAGILTDFVLRPFPLPADVLQRIDLIVFILFVFQILGYTLAAIRALEKNKESLVIETHILEPKDFTWLRNFLIALLTVYGLSFSITLLVETGFKELAFLYRVNQCFMMGLIYAVAYRILLRPEFLDAPKPVYLDKPKPKYARSGMTEELACTYLETLLHHMQTKKPYLNAELSLHELSEQTGISKNHLTQVLNEKLGKNFYEFINSYRIEEVKELIKNEQYENLNLSALGLQAGFKSKTGFISNFKKLTGTTPSDWKRTAANV